MHIIHLKTSPMLMAAINTINIKFIDTVSPVNSTPMSFFFIIGENEQSVMKTTSYR